MKSGSKKKNRFALGVLAVAIGQAAHAGDEPAQLLPEVTITSTTIDDRFESGYSVKHTTTGTKTDTPLTETPISVQVVPAEVIEDQRVNRLQEALENVSGIRSHNNDLEGYAYKIRGFGVLNLFRNGLAMPFTIPTIQETANIERIEVLKGPASVLYGRVDPGGLINLATKKPSRDPFYALEQEIGSYDHYRTQWDATGPINEAGTVTYRFSGAYQDENSFRDFQGGHRTTVAPVINFKFSENTELTLDFQYMDNKTQSDTGFPVIGTKPAPIPLSRSFQEPNDPLDKTESHSVGYEFKHRFNDSWSVSNRFLFSDAELWKLNVYGTALDEVTGILDRATQFQLLDGKVYSTNLDLNGKFAALGAKHDFLIGLDYLHDYFDYNYAEGGGNFQINIFNPAYGGITAADYQDAVDGIGFKSFSSVLLEQIGVYVQDQITWFDKLHLLVGGRLDNAKRYLGRSFLNKEEAIADRAAQPVREDKQFSPRLGLLYQFMPNFGAYASYSESFGNNNGVSATGATFDPERGIQYEAGLKAQVLKGLTVNLAAFQLTKKNVLTADLSTPDPNDSIISGEQRSRGVEVDVLGQVTDRLSLTGAYAYTTTKVTHDNNGFQGNQLDNVPRNSGKLFLVYDLGSGGPGWRIGGGFYAASKAQGDLANSFEIPGYTRVDAFASYSGKAGTNLWTAQLNLRNVFNKKYFDGTDTFYNAANRLNLLPAQPFTATATFKLEF